MGAAPDAVLPTLAGCNRSYIDWAPETIFGYLWCNFCVLFLIVFINVSGGFDSPNGWGFYNLLYCAKNDVIWGLSERVRGILF